MVCFAGYTYKTHHSCILAFGNNHRHTVRVLKRAGLQTRPGDFKEIQPADIGFVASSVWTRPGVEAKMVVIAVPGDKPGLAIEISLQFQTKGLLVIGDALIQVADVEVHMSTERP